SKGWLLADHGLCGVRFVARLVGVVFGVEVWFLVEVDADDLAREPSVGVVLVGDSGGLVPADVKGLVHGVTDCAGVRDLALGDLLIADKQPSGAARPHRLVAGLLEFIAHQMTSGWHWVGGTDVGENRAG